jgi:hypothetical protein
MSHKRKPNNEIQKESTYPDIGEIS